ncbi:RagB/SusD family nutrient uptake outer membrane protein [Adhaeribacter arboris]|uniref:RagB/SusD family nutrient uptake outer membrane protein n=1 Tax=Adhaeribacter arboris TaxID=2072846 RepID=A0A2T2YHT1_9BACT|nr:RagB/SusD family nutrient uptake outer membrane protein [Adhaeribacter arboris]PSR55064.1 RagB/SusD family nutrient uptake outer membrane protein [Adhaeribacter arboris]
MNKSLKYIAIALVSGGLLAGCNEDYLNTLPLDKAPGDLVWTDAALAESAVTELYNGLHDGLLNQESMDCITDNALYNFGKQDIMEANISPSNTGWVNNTYEYGEMYSRIRAANIALKKLATPQFENTNGIVERLKGETYFMRAYFYNQMLRYYGGIPIIKSPYELTSSDFTIARNTYEECVNFIVSDLDSASMLLQGKTLATGRATNGAALALKSRVLLYAASDLHDIPTASGKSTVIGGFSNKELLGYVSGDQNARWQAAKDAAKAVIDLGIYGYNLNLSAPVTPEEGRANYVNLYLSRNGGEKDAIFLRQFINAKDEWGAWYPRNNGPNGYHGWTSSEPTQNLVDDYEMMDGTKFDWNNAEHKAAPYDNRDPRFYASILYDGAPWKPRTADAAGTDPFNQIQMGTYQVGSASSPTTYFGLDTRNSSIENWNGTRTGYAIRKFIDPNPAIEDQVTRQEVASPQIKFTEVVFNYIEACLELGQEAEAITWLNKIRFRSGMPPVSESGQALVERYRNERNIEMLFEEQRFYDARRWMIAKETLGEKVRIMKVTATLKPGKTVPVYKYSKDDYNYTYTVQEIDPGVENRKWDDKLYFMPINRDEMNRNNKLVQNPGYQ